MSDTTGGVTSAGGSVGATTGHALVANAAVAGCEIVPSLNTQLKLNE